jgi:hypothetical protein
MTYTRVIPRDLFNEGDLLKCYGRLWVLLDETRGHVAQLGEEEMLPGADFEIWQDEGDGSIFVANVGFRVRGVRWTLRRPLNARAAWPLYANSPLGDEFHVFTEDGQLSPEFFQAIIS